MKKSILTILLCVLFLLIAGCKEMPPTSASMLEPSDSPDIGRVVLRRGEEAIEWKYEGESEEAWKSLVSLSDILVRGEDGKAVELRSENDYVQWRLEGGEWTKLVSLADIKGPAGDDGANGKTPEFRVYENKVQWKYTGETAWLNMADLSLLDGKDGKAGKDGTVWHSGSGVLRTELLNPVAYVEGVKRGDYYLDTESGKIYVCEFAGMVSGGNNSRWRYLKNLSAEKGDKGEKGDTGATGDKGERGDKGDTGDSSLGLCWFSFSELLTPKASEFDKDGRYEHCPNLKSATSTTDLIKADGSTLKLADGHRYMVTISYTTTYLSEKDSKKYDQTNTSIKIYSKDYSEIAYGAAGFMEDHCVRENDSYTANISSGEYEFYIYSEACETIQYSITIIVLN